MASAIWPRCLIYDSPSEFELQKASSTAKAVTTSGVDSPASEAISGKSTFQCVGGGASILGNGCVPRVEKVAASASRSCARSRAPRSIRSTRSTRSFVRVLSRSDHGNVYACTFSANCCALGIARATAGGDASELKYVVSGK